MKPPRRPTRSPAASRPAVARPAPGPTGRRLSVFVIIFATLVTAYYALVLRPSGDQLLVGYLKANAWLASHLLKLAGQETQVRDVTIYSVEFAVSVRRGCDALEPAWIFCAAVLAFPLPWRRKPLALLGGSLAILALNPVRIASLYLLGRWQPALFTHAHLEIWPTAFVLLAGGLWLSWVRRGIAARASRHAAA